MGHARRSAAAASARREPVRVLVLHNRYRSEGGEERACWEIAALLEGRGHPVTVIEHSSETLSRARAARALLAGGVETERVAEAVRRFQADIVHVHNVHPVFGWRALAAAHGAGARTVFHLHNFRLFCAIGSAFQNGAPCHRCRGRNTLPGLRLRCRGSLGESAVYAAGLYRQQPHLIEQTDRFIAPSQAHVESLISLGLPPEGVTALPNFIARSRFATSSAADQGRYALVIGRLVYEKGFDTAVRAARAVGIPLVVAGAGADEARLRELAGAADVTFTGWVAADELLRLLRGAAVLLAPSRSEEAACPYSVLDALANGVPVLASDRGGLPELLDGQAVVPPEDQAAWSAKLDELWRSPTGRLALGEAVLETAQRCLNEDRYYQRLLEVYEGALAGDSAAGEPEEGYAGAAAPVGAGGP